MSGFGRRPPYPPLNTASAAAADGTPPSGASSRHRVHQASSDGSKRPASALSPGQSPVDKRPRVNQPGEPKRHATSRSPATSFSPPPSRHHSVTGTDGPVAAGPAARTNDGRRTSHSRPIQAGRVTRNLRGPNGSASPLQAASPLSITNGDPNHPRSGSSTPLQIAPPAPPMVSASRRVDGEPSRGVASIRAMRANKQIPAPSASSSSALAKLQGRNIVLQDLTQVQKDLTGVQKDLTGVQKDLMGVQEDFTGVQKDLTEFQNDAVQMRIRLDELESSKNPSAELASLEKIKQLEARIKKLEALPRQDPAAVQRSIEAVEDRVKQSVEKVVLSKLAKLRTDIDGCSSYKARLDALDTQLVDVTNHLRELKEVIMPKQLTNFQAKFDAHVSGATTTMDGIEGKMKAVEALVKEQATSPQHQELRDEIKKIREEKVDLATLTRHLESLALDNKLTRLDNDLRQHLHNTLTEKVTDIGEAMQEIREDAKTNKEEAQTRFALLDETTSEFERKFADLDATSSEVKGKFNDLDATASEVKRQLADLDRTSSKVIHLADSDILSRLVVVESRLESLVTKTSDVQPQTPATGATMPTTEYLEDRLAQVSQKMDTFDETFDETIDEVNKQLYELHGRVTRVKSDSDNTRENLLVHFKSEFGSMLNSRFSSLEKDHEKDMEVLRTYFSTRLAQTSLSAPDRERLEKTHDLVQNLETILAQHLAGYNTTIQTLRDEINAMSSTPDDQIGILQRGLKSLEDRWQNINTDALYQKMVHWFTQNYPNAPNLYRDVNIVKEQLDGLGHFINNIAWVEQRREPLWNLASCSKELLQLLGHVPALGDPGTWQSIESIHNSAQTALTKVSEVAPVVASHATQIASIRDHVDQVQAKTTATISLTETNLQGLIRTQHQTVERLRTGCDDIRVAIGKQNLRIDGVETKLQSQGKLIGDTDQLVGKLSKRMETAESNGEASSRTVETLRRVCNDTRGDIGKQNLRVDGVETKLQSQGKSIGDTEQSVGKLSKRIETMENLNSRMDGVETKLESQGKTIGEAKWSIARLSERQETAESNGAAFSIQLKELSEHAQEVDKTLTTQSQALGELQTMVEPISNLDLEDFRRSCIGYPELVARSFENRSAIEDINRNLPGGGLMLNFPIHPVSRKSSGNESMHKDTGKGKKKR